MKVSTAIKLLQELDPNATICAQWYDKDDMTVMGVEGEETLTDEEWELANAIIDKWEMPDMHTSLEEAIYVAKQRLAEEAKV